jgi:competence protein ComEC
MDHSFDNADSCRWSYGGNHEPRTWQVGSFPELSLYLVFYTGSKHFQLMSKKYLIVPLVLCFLFLGFTQVPDGNLHVVACNVGQGDAILIIYKNTQILTDAGPGKSVLDCLGRHTPFWDKRLELLINTHPDTDHAGGIPYVLDSYSVENFLSNSIDPGTQLYEVLKSKVGGSGIRVIDNAAAPHLKVGLIHLDILYPSASEKRVLGINEGGFLMEKYKSDGEGNLYSVVYKLSFKNFTGLFTGDIPPEISDKLAMYSFRGPIDYIKIPHHGSRNGLTENLLKAFEPKVAVISVGKNSYGHPHKEVMELLEKYKVDILRTDQGNDIEVITDGEKFRVRKN